MYPIDQQDCENHHQRSRSAKRRNRVEFEADEVVVENGSDGESL